MNKFIQICLVSFLMHSPMVFAEILCTNLFQQNGYFLDLGVSYNSVKIDQNFSASGTGNVYEGETLVATGEAGGPAAPFSETINTLAPVIQAGYSKCYGCSNNFWGLKCGYQYLGITSVDTLTDTPQAGFLDPVGGSLLSFTGNVITKSAQSKVDHCINLLAFVGFSLCDVNLYVGAGPSIFKTRTNIYQAFGFANLNGIPRDATGTPVSFSSSKWVWGGSGQIGISYILNPCWYLDVNYTYTISQNYRNNYSAPFSTTLIGGYTDIGTLYINTKTKIWAQNLCLTISRQF